MKTISDIGEAAIALLCGCDVHILPIDRQHASFKFEVTPQAEAKLKDWQSGQATGNLLAYLNCYRTLVRRVKNTLRGLSQ